MKRKFLTLILGTVLTCSLLSGCGNSPDTETTENTEVVEEEPKTWFENSGLSFTPAPEFSFLSSNYLTISSNITPSDVEMNASIFITTSKKEDGTKIITATMAFNRWTNEEKEWSLLANYGFVDLYTGTSIVTTNAIDSTASTEIEYEGHTYPITVNTKNISKGDFSSPSVRTVSVTCPIEYEGTGFLVYGSNEYIDNNIVLCTFDSFENIEHGDYDILLFEGVDTEGAEEISIENISDESETETTQESTTTPAVEAPAEEPVQQPVEAPAETTPAPVEQPTAPDTSYSGGSGDIFPGTPEWDAIFGGIDDSAALGDIHE